LQYIHKNEKRLTFCILCDARTMPRFWNNYRKGRTYHRPQQAIDVTATPSPTPLSTSTSGDVPFPWFQVIVLLCINYNESVQAQVIFPFVPFAVAHWGVKEHDIGFYVGVLIASFFFAQLLLVSWWGRLADHYGRRPILLVGLLGTAITMLIFGFASNYYVALVSRFLTGAMNGNIAISKVYMGELTTTKTQALGFSLLSFTWGLGIVTAPVIGGFLADPVTQFGPDSILGRVPFVKEYPYLLPSLFSVLVSVSAFIGGFFLLPESEAWKKNNSQRLATLNKSVSAKKSVKARKESGDGAKVSSKNNADNVDIEEEEEEDEVTAMITVDKVSIDENTINSNNEGRPRKSTDDELDGEIDGIESRKPESPPGHDSTSSSAAAATKATLSTQIGTDSKRKRKGRIDSALHGNDDSIPSGPLLPSDAKISDILKDKVVVSVVTAYTMLSFVQIVFDELLPVLFSTPIQEGGFGFQSKDIGSMQIVQGISQIVWNLVFFPTVSKKFGLLPCFRFAMLMWTPFALFPAIARLHPWPPLMWAVAGSFLCLKIVITASAFTCIILIINNSTRGSALGAVNGFAQASASFVRCVGPLVGGGLYTTSLIFGSYLGTWKLHIAYAVVSLMALSTFLFSFRVPKWVQEVWVDNIKAEDLEKSKNSGVPQKEEGEEEDEEESTPLNLKVVGEHG
jgi:MFS family permease